MAKKYLSTKFGIDLLDGFWENGFYGRTDSRVMTEAQKLKTNKKKMPKIESFKFDNSFNNFGRGPP